MAKELKTTSMLEKTLARNFNDMSSTFNKELLIEPDGSERYKNKFRKTLGIYQRAKKQVEAELRQQQRESDMYTPDMEAESSISSKSRLPKRKPPPLKTQPSRQSIPKKPTTEPPKVTWKITHETIKKYLPEYFLGPNRVPFAPLQRTVIQKAHHEKKIPLDPIDEFNLAMVIFLKF